MSSITFANQAELLDHWIVAFMIDLDRDWTWDGFAEPALSIFRDTLGSPIGTVSFPRTVSAAALGVCSKRRTGRPAGSSSSIPLILILRWEISKGTLSAVYDRGDFQERAEHPAGIYEPGVADRPPPSQTPKIASTGIAESPFQASPDYSETYLRDRYLWIEFAEPLADDDDAYFGRVLAYGPDPLLAASLLPPSPLPDRWSRRLPSVPSRCE